MESKTDEVGLDRPNPRVGGRPQLVLIAIFLSAAIFAADLATPLGVAMAVPYMAVVLLSLWIPGRKWTVGLAAAMSVLTALGFVFSAPGGELWQVLMNRALAFGAIGTTAVLVIYRKSLERRLEQAAAFHSSVINGAVDAIITMDERCIIQSANSAAASFFGYTLDELVGSNVNLIVPEPHQSEHDGYIQRYLRTGMGKIIGSSREVLARRKDGAIVPLQISVSESVTDAGRLFTGIARDISDRKKWEDEIRRRSEELEQTNKELDEFAYIASHDLKAPLRGIENLAHWIAEDAADVLPDESKRHLDLLKQRVRRMESLLDELLEYSRAGRAAHEVEWIDSLKLVEAIVDLYSVRDKFEVIIVPGMPAFSTWKVPLEQVFRNLIGNAVKHHDREEGRITVSAEENGEDYEFTVCDDGPGIPEAFHDRVFNMFQTLQPRDELEGSGMGLALVRKLVSVHGCEISLSSNAETRGATFRFTWPKEIKEDALDAGEDG